MFSFSMDKNARLDINRSQLAHHGVGKDTTLERQLQDEGDYRDDELYFRAENASPETVQAAVQYVLGLFFHPPLRVWLSADAVEVTDEHLDGIRKPTA